MENKPQNTSDVEKINIVISEINLDAVIGGLARRC